jgi:hypothetical protein
VQREEPPDDDSSRQLPDPEPSLASCSGQGPAKQHFGKPQAYWLKRLQSKDALERDEAIQVFAQVGTEGREAAPLLKPLLKDSLHKQKGNIANYHRNYMVISDDPFTPSLYPLQPRSCGRGLGEDERMR